MRVALAATSFLRSIAGFGFPLFAPAMYNALGFGKGNTILACVGILIGCPACVPSGFSPSSFGGADAFCYFLCAARYRPWLFWHYGERIRAASRHAHKS